MIAIGNVARYTATANAAAAELMSVTSSNHVCSRHQNNLNYSYLLKFSYTCIHKDKQTHSCIVGCTIFAKYLEMKWEDEYFPRYFTEGFHSRFFFFLMSLKY